MAIENQNCTQQAFIFQAPPIHKRTYKDPLQNHDINRFMPKPAKNIEVLGLVNTKNKASVAFTIGAFQNFLTDQTKMHIMIPIGPSHYRGIYLTKKEDSTYELELFGPYGPQDGSTNEQLILAWLKQCNVQKEQLIIVHTGPDKPQSDGYSDGDYTCAHSHKKMQDWTAPESTYDAGLIRVLKEQGNKDNALRITIRAISTGIQSTLVTKILEQHNKVTNMNNLDLKPALPSQVKIHLEKLHHKIISFEAQRHLKATKATQLLMTNICSSWQQHHNELSRFKDEVIIAIDIAHIELNQHRGMKKLLTNILIAISTLFIAPLINYYRKGHFFKPIQTDSEKALHQLSAVINLHEAETAKQDASKKIHILTTGFATHSMNFAAMEQAFTKILQPLREAGYSKFEFIHYDTLDDDPAFYHESPEENAKKMKQVSHERWGTIDKVMSKIIPNVAKNLGIFSTQVTQKFMNQYLASEELGAYIKKDGPFVVLDGAHAFAPEGRALQHFPNLRVVYHPIYEGAGNESNPLPEFLLIASPSKPNGFQTCTEYAHEQGIEFDRLCPCIKLPVQDSYSQPTIN